MCHPTVVRGDFCIQRSRYAGVGGWTDSNLISGARRGGFRPRRPYPSLPRRGGAAHRCGPAPQRPGRCHRRSVCLSSHCSGTRDSGMIMVNSLETQRSSTSSCNAPSARSRPPR
ncbi:hypothetical protein STRIP9103_03215 [Streptomyces ipomoeae 91-03]|uniref:Uncharacterized protein n=1 Tax=Streptomyces ipomoeae 91-03 TaxID=698759 RepID=L1L9I7_9ACTN|nr:hypothetical protein STRIP9103_03215 [Streptomyces ipomoeae 91-03]